MMIFNEPYEHVGKEPAEIRHDLLEYFMGCDSDGRENVMRTLLQALPSEQLGDIMNDMMMGRL